MERGRGSIVISEAALSHVEEAGAHEADQTAVSILQKCAVFMMTFGPGSAVATYTNLFGWYQHQLKSREVLLFMRIALFAPFPLMKMVQSRYDQYFDEIFSTRTAYLFRIVIMQVVVAMLMVVWMLLPGSVDGMAPVVAFGVVLGACCAPFIGSSVQIAVAIDPILLIWAQLGNTIGMSVPVLVVAALNFEPNSSHSELCKVLLAPMIVCLLAALWLGILHRSAVFHHAFAAISRRRSTPMLQAPESTPEQVASEPQEQRVTDVAEGDEPEKDVPESHAMQIGSSAPESGAMQEGVSSSSEPGEVSQTHGRRYDIDNPDKMPSWVWLWLSMQSVALAVDFVTLSLIGYFGDAHTTHRLSQGTLLSAATGRLVSLPIRNLSCFDQGPMHVTGVLLFCVRIALWFICLLRLCNVWQPTLDVLLVAWCSWNVVGMIHNSLTDMTVTANVADAKKQVAAQYSLITSYSGVVIGMLMGTGLALLAENGIGVSTDDVSGLLLFLPRSAGLNRNWASSPIGPKERMFGSLVFFLEGSTFHTIVASLTSA